jgi:hypothetical protein
VFAKLLGLQYKILYRKGFQNTTTYSLSRRGHSDQLLAVSVVTPSWLSDVVAGYQQDPMASNLLAPLTLQPNSHPRYLVQNGVIRYNLAFGWAPTNLLCVRL